MSTPRASELVAHTEINSATQTLRGFLPLVPLGLTFALNSEQTATEAVAMRKKRGNAMRQVRSTRTRIKTTVRNRSLSCA
jgi:hypothetical protein